MRGSLRVAFALPAGWVRGQRAVVVVNPMEGRKGHDASLIGRDRKVRPQRPHGRRPPPHHGVLVLVGWQQEVKLSFGNI